MSLHRVLPEEQPKECFIDLHLTHFHRVHCKRYLDGKKKNSSKWQNVIQLSAADANSASTINVQATFLTKDHLPCQTTTPISVLCKLMLFCNINKL